MRLRSVVGRGLTVLGAAIAATFSIHAFAHEPSHSLEADQNDARLEGPQAMACRWIRPPRIA